MLVGGVGSTRISEALFEIQEVKEENKKLWDVVKTLMSNQTKLEQQYIELKSQVSGSQKCPSIETSPRFDTVDGKHLHDKNEDNQESISHLNKRHGVELEETRNVRMQSLQKIKRETAEHTHMGNTKEKTTPQSLEETSKKQRKFQAPLNKDDMEDIKCGMEIGLTSPNSKKLVALGTVQKTDRKAKANDGQPLADYIEVLVSIVYKQTTILPRAHGKIQYLGSATTRCIPWPRQNDRQQRIRSSCPRSRKDRRRCKRQSFQRSTRRSVRICKSVRITVLAPSREASPRAFLPRFANI